MTTRPRVIEREVLVKVGERYSQVLVDETAKNLRSVRQLSVVLAIPVMGSKPGTVRLLVGLVTAVIKASDVMLATD